MSALYFITVTRPTFKRAHIAAPNDVKVKQQYHMQLEKMDKTIIEVEEIIYKEYFYKRIFFNTNIPCLVKIFPEHFIATLSIST